LGWAVIGALEQAPSKLVGADGLEVVGEISVGRAGLHEGEDPPGVADHTRVLAVFFMGSDGRP
jgi:hypothetical protein